MRHQLPGEKKIIHGFLHSYSLELTPIEEAFGAIESRYRGKRPIIAGNNGQVKGYISEFRIE